jgi:hypothetical protein
LINPNTAYAYTYHKHIPITGICILPHLESMHGPHAVRKYYLQTNPLTVISNRSCWALCWWIPTQILQFLKEKRHIHWITKINLEHTSQTSIEYFTSSHEHRGRNNILFRQIWLISWALFIRLIHKYHLPMTGSYFLHLLITELPKYIITLGLSQSCYNGTL